jgi:hypothetical protein
VPLEYVQRVMLIVRRHRVLLDQDLAVLYGVEVKALKQAVKRNIQRFPSDFMFELTMDEARALARAAAQGRQGDAHPRSQSVTLDAEPSIITALSVKPTTRLAAGKNVKYVPYAFTEQGVAMLSTVLRSRRAIQVNIEIMRAFVRLRQVLQGNSDLAKKLADLEARYDGQFRVVFEAIRQLMTVPEKATKRIGFRTEDAGARGRRPRGD